MEDRSRQGLCFNCTEKFGRGHKRMCQLLFFLDNNLVEATEEEDEPIEIHPANEKEPDLFASNGGSPTGFFG